MRGVDLLQRIEWLAVLGAALVAYTLFGGSWWLFALLILAPDLTMLFYLAGPRIGAIAYNTVHALVGPAFLMAAGLLGLLPWAVPVALIWLAHVAADRVLGYGLKLPEGFAHTHMGRIGR